MTSTAEYFELPPYKATVVIWFSSSAITFKVHSVATGACPGV